MYCRQCGYNNDRYSKLCKRCGSDLQRAELDSLKPEPVPEQTPGKLRFEPKKETPVEWIKSRFKRLERAVKKEFNLRAVIIAGAVILALAAGTLVALALANRESEAEIIYGSDPCNIAHGSLAASDDNWLVYSIPYGDNPGLYRVMRSTGESLKISYLTPDELSIADGWIYGVLPDGTFIRISIDGLVSQNVIESTYPKYINIVGDDLFYIDGQTARIMKADLTTVTDRSSADERSLLDEQASCLLAYEGHLYYTTNSSTVQKPGLVIISGSDAAEETPSGGSVDKPAGTPKSTTTTTASTTKTSTTTASSTTTTSSTRATAHATVPPYDPNTTHATIDPATVGGGTQPILTGLEAGKLYRMNMDGSESELLVDIDVFNMSIAGDYIYFFSEQIATVSATDVDPNAPAYMTVDRVITQCWRYSLRTGGYAKYLEPGLFFAPLIVHSGSIYSVDVEGDIIITDSRGASQGVVVTGIPGISRMTLTGGYMFYRTSDGLTLGRTPLGSAKPEILCVGVPDAEEEE